MTAADAAADADAAPGPESKDSLALDVTNVALGPEDGAPSSPRDGDEVDKDSASTRAHVDAGSDTSSSLSNSTAGASSVHKGVRRIAQRIGYSPAFSQIRLQRAVGLVPLVLLTLGGVLDGEYSGWNFGSTGGVGGLLAAFLVISLMYACFVSSLAELASVFPFAGASYAYVRGTMGKLPGLLVILCDIAEFVIGASATTFTSGVLLGQLFFEGARPELDVLWAFLLAGCITSLMIFGGTRLYQVISSLTGVALVVLCVWIFGGFHFISFYANALAPVAPPAADSSTEPSATELWFPLGVPGFFVNLTFAIWFYLGLEIVPFVAEDVRTPSRVVPRALLISFGVLFVLAILTLFVGVALPPGIVVLAIESLPMNSGFAFIFSTDSLRLSAALQLASFIIGSAVFLFAGVRALFAASRAGFLPPFLCFVYGRADVPVGSILFASLVMYLAVLVSALPSDSSSSEVLIAMTTIGTLVSQIFKMLAFIILRVKYPRAVLHRPFYSPLGIAGAVVALVLAAIALVCIFVYQSSSAQAAYALLGFALWIILGVLYYAFVGRKRLFLSPEELAAVQLNYRDNIELVQRRVQREAPLQFDEIGADYFRLTQVLHDPVRASLFEAYLKQIFCHENLLFHQEVAHIRRLAPSTAQPKYRAACMRVYATYLAPNSVLQVNITGPVAVDIKVALDSQADIPLDIFDRADAEVLHMLSYDCMRKFEEAEAQARKANRPLLSSSLVFSA